MKTSSYRIQAQLLNFPTSRLLWINVYLPTDPQTLVFDDTDLLEVLSELTKIIETTDFTDILVNGDLTWDPSRRSGHSVTVNRFVENLGLVPLWKRHPVDYTHIHTDMRSTSVLDHFLVNERLVLLVEECRAIHSGDNLSRRSPILLKLKGGDIPLKKKLSTWLPKKPAWDKATPEILDLYKADLEERLASKPPPASYNCLDPHCANQAHSLERDNHALDILCSVVEASHCNLPMAGWRKGGSGPGNDSGCVAGWKQEVEPFREDANFWHAVWVSVGKPAHGHFHIAMARSRNQYHYAVRRTKRSADLLIAKNLFEASLTGDLNLIEEMKKRKSGGKAAVELPDNVSGAQGEL